MPPLAGSWPYWAPGAGRAAFVFVVGRGSRHWAAGQRASLGRDAALPGCGRDRGRARRPAGEAGGAARAPQRPQSAAAEAAARGFINQGRRANFKGHLLPRSGGRVRWREQEGRCRKPGPAPMPEIPPTFQYRRCQPLKVIMYLQVCWGGRWGAGWGGVAGLMLGQLSADAERHYSSLTTRSRRTVSRSFTHARYYVILTHPVERKAVWVRGG